jgi:hypothetical protein
MQSFEHTPNLPFPSFFGKYSPVLIDFHIPQVSPISPNHPPSPKISVFQMFNIIWHGKCEKSYIPHIPPQFFSRKTFWEAQRKLLLHQGAVLFGPISKVLDMHIPQGDMEGRNAKA